MAFLKDRSSSWFCSKIFRWLSGDCKSWTPSLVGTSGPPRTHCSPCSWQHDPPVCTSLHARSSTWGPSTPPRVVYVWPCALVRGVASSRGPLQLSPLPRNFSLIFWGCIQWHSPIALLHLPLFVLSPFISRPYCTGHGGAWPQLFIHPRLSFGARIASNFWNFPVRQVLSVQFNPAGTLEGSLFFEMEPTETAKRFLAFISHILTWKSLVINPWIFI